MSEKLKKFLLHGILAFGPFLADASQRIEIQAPYTGVEPKLVLFEENSNIRLHWTGGSLLGADSIVGPFRILRAPFHARNGFTVSTAKEADFFTVQPSTAAPEYDREMAALHIPDNYSQENNYPLIVSFHFYNFGSMLHPFERLNNNLNFEDLVDSAQILLLTPIGIFQNNAVRGPAHLWSATEQCCVYEQRERMLIDDTGYSISLIQKIISEYSVDPDRVYVVGAPGNGGTMALQVAAKFSEIVAAAVGINAYAWTDPADGNPNSPLSILRIDGDQDEEGVWRGGVPWYGFDAKTGERINFTTVSAITLADEWVDRLGCDPFPDQWNKDAYDLDRSLPGMDTDTRDATGCDRGVTVSHWRIKGGKHYPQISESYASTILNWLMANPKTHE